MMKKGLVAILSMLFLFATLSLIGCGDVTDKVTLTKVEKIEATCETPGNIGYFKDEATGKLYSDEEGTTEITAESVVIAPLGHDVVHKTAKEATCTEEGNIEYWECKRCNKLFSDEALKNEITKEQTIVSLKAHTLTAHEKVEATCETKGNIAYWTCDVCGKFFSDEEGKTEITEKDTVIEALGHTLTAHERVEATCETKGNIAYWTCDVCGKFFSDENGTTEITEADTVIEALGHKLTHHDKKDAGVNPGNIEYWTCDVCGKYFSDKDGTTEITKESIVTKLAYAVDNPASYIYTEVPYSYNAELNCYETLYEGVYNWKTPESVVIVKKEYIDYLIAEGYDKLTFKVVRANDVATTKVAVAANDPNATELGTYNGTEGQYTVLLNDLPTDEFIVKDGNITLKFFANKLAVDLRVYITPSKITISDIYLGYVETGSPFTYNEAEACYERDYATGEGWGDLTKFTIKKEYLDILRANGATKLMIRAIGLGNMDIGQPDAGASKYASRGTVAICPEPIDLTNLPVEKGIVENGSLAFKIYSSVSTHVKVYISTDIDDKYNDFGTFDSLKPETFVKSRDPFRYNSEDKTYNSFAINYQKALGNYESEFIIVKEYIDYLKTQNITQLQIKLSGKGGTSFIETSAKKTLNKGQGEPAVYVINIEELPESDLLDSKGNVFLRVCTNADSNLKVEILPL